MLDLGITAAELLVELAHPLQRRAARLESPDQLQAHQVIEGQDRLIDALDASGRREPGPQPVPQL